MSDDIKDLVSQASSTVSHDSKIDFLELNARGDLLLFRDKRRQLHLYEMGESHTRHTLLSYCTYAQWVPESDVVVAQNRSSLCVWYNIRAPDQVNILSSLLLSIIRLLYLYLFYSSTDSFIYLFIFY